jgi:hypothetical protein
METVLAGQATGGEAVLEQVKVAARDDVDYRAFLRRFAVPREVMAVDGDSFDYIFYTYGLSLYGNIPLVEPLEYCESPHVRDFVVARMGGRRFVRMRKRRGSHHGSCGCGAGAHPKEIATLDALVKQ